MNAEKNTYRPPGISTIEELSARLLMANSELEQANRKLRESEKARKEMLANVSHDLRAPANAVRSAIDRLKYAKSLTREETAAVVDVLDRRAAALERLIGELYYLVALDSPQTAPQAVRLDVAPLVEEYWITWRERRDLAGRELALELPEGFSATVDADPDHLVRMLDNLLQNALHFTDENGRIAIGCDALEAGFVDIWVRDDGCGIATEHLERVFERTFTVSRARGEGGTGLGLSIVRRLAELAGGRVWCESRAGAGSRFIIRLPLSGA